MPGTAAPRGAGGVASPCVGVCVVGADGLCEGCLRSLEEIAAWGGMSDGERRAVLSELAGRRDGDGRTIPFTTDGPRAREHESMSVEEKIRDYMGQPAVLFMKGTPDFPQCGFSAQAVQVLRAAGVEFAHVNILEDPELREALKRHANWPTYPQFYVRGELMGGSDILLEMYRSGELQEKLGSTAA